MKKLYVIKFDDGFYWGGMKGFVKNLYQAQIYVSKKNVNSTADYILNYVLNRPGDSLKTFNVKQHLEQYNTKTYEIKEIIIEEK